MQTTEQRPRMPSFTWVMRHSRERELFRLFRVTWEREGTSEGPGHLATLSVGLRLAFFRYRRDEGEVPLTVLFLRVHYLCTSRF